jgi:predicted DNA-binding ribbon-helix-helix protein
MVHTGKARGRPSLVSRNVTVNGRRTSLRMEPLLWESLKDIAAREGMTVFDVCSQVDSRRKGASLTASLRIFIVSYFRRAAPLSRPRGFEDTPEHEVSLLERSLNDAIPLPDTDSKIP